jgi:aryl-alcohol dehydrogenase-like predicted oxidoreductase
METQIERRRRALTPEDVSALVDAIEARAMDRIQKSLGRTVLNLALTWALRTIFFVAIYSAGAAGILRRVLPS